jgi:hypothetical protein
VVAGCPAALRWQSCWPRNALQNNALNDFYFPNRVEHLKVACNLARVTPSVESQEVFTFFLLQNSGIKF